MSTDLAILWIRDGVLIDRMHLNAVMFAIAAFVYADTKGHQRLSLTPLINFAFAHSGISCIEKLQILSTFQDCSESCITRELIPSAADFYDRLSASCGSKTNYFPGAVDTLKSLFESGARNYITSAIAQGPMSLWAKTEQAEVIRPYLQDILASSPEFVKGPDHFRFVQKENPGARLFIIADAISEIKVAARFKETPHLVPVGFANVIQAAQIQGSQAIVEQQLPGCLDELNILETVIAKLAAREMSLEGLFESADDQQFQLVNQNVLTQSLLNEGAAVVAEGTAGVIYKNLQRILFNE